MQIRFEATAHVKDALDHIGRTEDLAFSPDNRRLAITAYAQNKILMLDIEISATVDGTRIFISDYYEILSADLNLPHGITWIDDQTIVIGNRFGQAIILTVPLTQITQKQLELSATQVLPPVLNNTQHSNDCLTIIPLGQGLYEVLVCSNSGNYVASHILDNTENFNVLGSAILLENKLQIPDGIAFSPDRRWIAVSNHVTHSVYIYENVKSLGPASEPCAVLPGITYPHGMTFSESAHFLFVAAAGDPFIYGYHNPYGKWSGEYQPFTKFKTLDDETFKRGNFNEQEGGIKGICFAHDSNILAMTCSEQPLAFTDMSALMNAHAPEAASALRPKTLHQNSEDYLQRTIRCMKINHNRLTELHNDHVQTLLSSTSWKITHPLRVLKRFFEQCATAIKSWQS